MSRSRFEVMAGVAAITAGLMLPALVSAAADDDVPPRGQMLERLDTNHDGKISLEERQAAGHARFKEMDKNGDGFVSRDEALAEARKRAAERVDRMFKFSDANGDGKISQAEFDAAGEKMRDRAEARRHRAGPPPDAPADKPE